MADPIALRVRWNDPGMCTACRSCEVACSFHHARAFNPAISSVKIIRNYSDGQVTIEHYWSCDGCLEEGGPLCIEFCARGVLSREFLGLAT